MPTVSRELRGMAVDATFVLDKRETQNRSETTVCVTMVEETMGIPWKLKTTLT